MISVIEPNEFNVNLPKFLVIGVPKSGTTSLHHYLSKHPSIFMPEHKELHFFTSDLIASNVNGPGDFEASSVEIIKNQDEYNACFKGAKDGKVVGEVSPSYFYFASECTSKIKSLLNNVKIILILRDPIERAFSNYLHLIREGRETLGFADAIKIENQRKQDGYGDFWRYTDHSLYYDKTQYILDQFGEENVKLVVNEQFKADPCYIMQDIFRFIGVDSSVIINTETAYNNSTIYKENLVTRLLNGKSTIKSTLMNLLPDSAADRLRQMKSRSLKAHEAPKPELTIESAEYLRNYFRSDVESMAQYVDVSYWKTTHLQF